MNCTISECTGAVLARGWCQRHYRRWQSHGTPVGRGDPQCQTCGRSFLRRNPYGTLPRYCSNDCDPRIATPRVYGTCIVCGIETDGFGTFRSFCSSRCQSERVNYPNGRPTRASCVKCGTEMDMTVVGVSGRRPRLDRTMCRGCRRNANYPMTVGDLAKRDGTDCSICSEPVDMTLRFPNRWCPTVEHVVAVTRGGGNEPENLALAHFRCNVRKGNRLSA